MTIFLILFAILLFLAFLNNILLANSFLGSRWRLFVAPGVIFHELCHAFACLISGAKIVSISFFDKEGGSVTHQKPFIPVLGPILIAVSPLVLGILVFYFLAARIQLVSALDFSFLFFNFKSVFKSIDIGNWQNILILYLLISMAVTFTPSSKDLRNMIVPVAILAVIFYLLFHFTSLNFSRFDYIFVKLSLVLNLVISILFIFFVISLLFYLISKFVLKR